MLVVASALLFFSPSVIHAQTSEPSGPACELQLSHNKPGQFCVPQTIVIKPGDSNTTIKERAERERLEKEAQNRRLRRIKSVQYSQAGFANSYDVAKLYPESGQCVPYARRYSGIPISGVARDVSVDSQSPEVGSVIITYESSLGHAAVVVAVQDGSIRIRDRNYISGWVTERTLPLNSPLIKGFVSS